MPKGEGSPRIVFLSADLLEERMLLSHLASSSAVHALSTANAQQIVTLPAAKTDSDTGHSPSTNTEDVQERDAEQVAAAAQAASSSSKDQYTIPLIFNKGMVIESDEVATNLSSTIAWGRSLRVSYADEHVAWGGPGSTSSNSITMPRSWSELTPEIPELSLEVAIDGELTAPAEVKEPAEVTLESLASKGADLIAPYLPFDRAGLEQAIDQLIDGIELLGVDIATDGESAELIPLPIAWGIGLATVEVIRRRLRSRREREREGDDQTDGDPALGIRGLTA